MSLISILDIGIYYHSLFDIRIDRPAQHHYFGQGRNTHSGCLTFSLSNPTLHNHTQMRMMGRITVSEAE